MDKKSKRKSLSLTIRNYFITGVVVLIPIGFTLYLTKILIGISSNLIPKNLNPNHYLPFDIPGVEILISILLITLVGGLSLSFFGKRILKLIDDLFQRIPFLRTVYSAIVQMTETFSKKNDDTKSVVLVEYPRKGVWAVGFATKENTGEMADKTNKKLINVFVPTTPNPTSGFLLMFPIEDVIYLNMSFEEASKFIVSAKSESGFVLALVNFDQSGISIASFPTVDGQTCAEISFENVSLDPNSIIASGPDAENLMKESINLATLCVSAEAVGCMTSCYLKTVEYTKSREQFGQPISNFQVLQHRMVDMFIESELCKSLLFKAMLEVDSGSDDKYKHLSSG